MTESDFPFVRKLYISTRLDELAVTGWPVEAQERFLSDQFELQHLHYQKHYIAADWLIVERDGEAIGRLYVEQRADDLRIIDIALMPTSRGQGCGTAILTDLLVDSRSIGSSVSIHVEKNNPARNLYLRLGFVPIAEHGIYDLMASSVENEATS